MILHLPKVSITVPIAPGIQVTPKFGCDSDAKGQVGDVRSRHFAPLCAMDKLTLIPVPLHFAHRGCADFT